MPYKITALLSVLIFYIAPLFNNTVFAESDLDAKIIIDIDNKTGSVNRKILGNNILGYRDNKRAEFYNTYGGGVWNPVTKTPDAKYLKLMKEAGISSLRWPGGKWRKSMHWKSRMVGADRQPFGLPEYLQLCQELNAEPVITLSAKYPEIVDIESLFAYLNEPLNESSTNNKRQKWARLRARDGRKEPWNVKWFEFGNENFNTDLSVSDYISNYKKTYQIIRSFGADAKLGVVLEDSDNTDTGWTYTVLKELGTNEGIDFGIIHPYLPMVVKGAIEKLGMERLIKASLYADANFEYRLQRYQEAAKKLGWKNPLKLAATEYNAHFKQQEPVKVRNTLSTALHNADFIRIMLEPRNNVIFANYWHLANGYWGMLRGFPHKKKKIQLLPNYFVYKIYNKYLLDDIVVSHIDSPEIAIAGTVGIGPRLPEKPSPYKTPDHKDLPDHWSRQYFSDGEQSQDDGILKVKFVGKKDVDYRHAYKVVSVEPNTLYRISTQVRINNFSHGKIGFAVDDLRGWKETFYQAKNLNLKPSDTWTWLSIDFRTSGDTDKIRIIPRKYRGHGKTKGTAEFGKIKIEKLNNDLPAGRLITGLATISNDNKQLAFILINKELNNSITTHLQIPAGYTLSHAEALTGDSPLATKYKTKGKGDFSFADYSANVKKSDAGVIIELEPHSITALKFRKP